MNGRRRGGEGGGGYRQGNGGGGYYRRGGSSVIGWVVGIVVVLAVIGLVAFLLLPRRSHRGGGSRYISRGPVASTSREAPQMEAKVGSPDINLKAVEKALWDTKAKNPKDFVGWMTHFENEVNAIYVATLQAKKAKKEGKTLPKNPPKLTKEQIKQLLPKPVRVEPKWETVNGNKLLRVHGYIDKNNKKGFQKKEDKLLFTLKQTKPYQKGDKKYHYSLRDGSGFYYRNPTYAHSVAGTAAFLGFYHYGWRGGWYRPYSSFGWYHGGPFLYGRYGYYWGMYPGYWGFYRRHYYGYYRPWGWGRGRYFRGYGGRYYYHRGYGRYGRRAGFRGGRGRGGWRGGGRRGGYGRGGRGGGRRGGYGRGGRGGFGGGGRRGGGFGGKR